MSGFEQIGQLFKRGAQAFCRRSGHERDLVATRDQEAHRCDAYAAGRPVAAAFAGTFARQLSLAFSAPVTQPDAEPDHRYAGKFAELELFADHGLCLGFGRQEIDKLLNGFLIVGFHMLNF